MNNLNSSVDEVVECPLCMEPLEVDDLNFFPCTCGYQICRFCWHRIRTDENELCPACRKEYPENPADFKPLTQEEMIAFKSQKKQRDQQRKQKITENRKHLANVRVVQKNLVFVVGLPPRLADADILKKHEYFGRYGKIHKVVINPSTTYAGVQGPSASAYVTYVHNTDALKAIQSVNNIMIDGRLIKTSLGTTKYCSNFMKNQQCPKADCMYLHELGDLEASFTKEEMQQGKHQEYEKRLHDVLIASLGTTTSGCGASTGTSSSVCNGKNSENFKMTDVISTPSTSVLASSSSPTLNNLTSFVSSAPQKEAWPSLSTSPVNQKDSSSTYVNKNKKERIKQEKNKNGKAKNNRTNSSAKDIDLPVIISNLLPESSRSINNSLIEETAKSKLDKSKEKNQISIEMRLNQKNGLSTTTVEENEKKDFYSSKAPTLASFNPDNNEEGFICSKIANDNNITEFDSQYSLSSTSNSRIVTTGENNSIIIENESGKSSPGSSYEQHFNDGHTNSQFKTSNRSLVCRAELDAKSHSNINKNNLSDKCSKSYVYVDNLLMENKNNYAKKSKHNANIEYKLCLDELTDNNRLEEIYNKSPLKQNQEDDSITGAMSKLNLFDENSFFSTTTEILQRSLPMKLKHSEEVIPNHFSTSMALNLPDLINGIDGYQNNTNDFKTSSHNDVTGSDLSRQSSYLQYQMQSNKLSNDNALQNSLFGTNMSKFFDFHKHQQQQKLQQQCLQMHSPNNFNGCVNESIHIIPLIENNHLNSQLVDHDCILTPQQQHQKQKSFGKIDQLLCHQTLQQLPNQQIRPAKALQNQCIYNSTGDDELGFDPFIETQKALAELIETEEEQHIFFTTSSKHANSSHQPHQQHMMDYLQRTRMPPPGFNNVTNFNGYNVIPRTQNSKVMPFMNLSNTYTASSGQPIQHQQLQIPSSAWGTHVGNHHQRLNEQQLHQVNSNLIHSGVNQKGYTAGNDWTAMDPAILSFRQFSFPHQTQVTPQNQPQQQETFLQQLAQQQRANFTSQTQHVSGGNAGVTNTILNSPQPQVNANVQGMLEYLKTRQFV